MLPSLERITCRYYYEYTLLWVLSDSQMCTSRQVCFLISFNSVAFQSASSRLAINSGQELYCYLVHQDHHEVCHASWSYDWLWPQLLLWRWLQKPSINVKVKPLYCFRQLIPLYRCSTRTCSQCTSRMVTRTMRSPREMQAPHFSALRWCGGRSWDHCQQFGTRMW
jgi:hypothetical protein